MDRYILQKDLPDSQAGDVYEYLDVHGAYFKNGDASGSYWMPKNVVNNPKWFLKEPELQYYVIAQPFNALVKSDTKVPWSVYRRTKEDMEEYAYAEYFPDPKSASDFILEHRPCLSLKEVEVTYFTPRGYPDFCSALKEFVKTKL